MREFTYEINKHNKQVTIIKYKGISQSYTIPFDLNGNRITTIGRGSFANRERLKSITISALYILDEAFRNCTNLEIVKLEGSVVSIGLYTFWGCKQLKEIVIPEGVKYIRHGAFKECERLTEIKIPYSVEAIGKNVFSDCSNLRQIFISKVLFDRYGRNITSCCNDKVKILIY